MQVRSAAQNLPGIFQLLVEIPGIDGISKLLSDEVRVEDILPIDQSYPVQVIHHLAGWIIQVLGDFRTQHRDLSRFIDRAHVFEFHQAVNCNIRVDEIGPVIIADLGLIYQQVHRLHLLKLELQGMPEHTGRNRERKG